ncbi:MAG: hypothetical protein ABSG94_11690, partial [Brevinematales bacterium]
NVFVTVAVGTAAAYSSDGVIWHSANPLPVSANWTQVSYGNGEFIAIGNNPASLAVSTDGINWTSQTLPAASYTQWISVCFGDNRFVAVAANCDSSAYYGGN